MNREKELKLSEAKIRWETNKMRAICALKFILTSAAAIALCVLGRVF